MVVRAAAALAPPMRPPWPAKDGVFAFRVPLRSHFSALLWSQSPEQGAWAFAYTRPRPNWDLASRMPLIM